MNTCEYCNKSFSNKSNLSNHQKTAKFCLDKRETECKEYICSCEKIFTTKINLERHVKSCKISLILSCKEENIKLKNENKIYLKQLEDKDKHIR